MACTHLSNIKGVIVMSWYNIVMLILVALPLLVNFGKFLVKCLLDFFDNRYIK